MEGQRAQETPSGIPYIGSLIALTSASGQRYRGTLYTVDLNESTIALQNGGFLMPLLHACQLFAFLHADTDERSGSHAVTLGADDPPTGPVYEFIKFRGQWILPPPTNQSSRFPCWKARDLTLL